MRTAHPVERKWPVQTVDTVNLRFGAKLGLAAPCLSNARCTRPNHQEALADIQDDETTWINQRGHTRMLTTRGYSVVKSQTKAVCLPYYRTTVSQGVPV
jgi:hypothetical protein